MILIVLIAIAIVAFFIYFLNKCYNKPFKSDGKCVEKCDNYIAEDGETCVDTCPNFIDEENKKCLAKCPSYKPYSTADKYCSPYNILDTKTNLFNVKSYSNDNIIIDYNELSASDDSKVIAIYRDYKNSQDELIQDYFISRDLGNTFVKYAVENGILTFLKVSPKGETVAVVSDMIKVYHENYIYVQQLEHETETMLHSQFVSDYIILTDNDHYYLYNLTTVEKESGNITYKHGIKVSTNYGKTFQTLYETDASSIDILNTKLAVSKDKKGIVYTVEDTLNKTSKVFSSKDAGKTFTSQDIKGTVTSTSINENGSCRVVASYISPSQSPSKGFLYVSKDHGATWKEFTIAENITKFKIIAMTERGQNQLYLFERAQSNGILFSKDYGETFSYLYDSVDSNNMVTGAAMTLDSKFITICTNKNIKVSKNYGDTFETNEREYANLGSSSVSDQVHISSSEYNYLNGKIHTILSSANSLFYTTLL